MVSSKYVTSKKQVFYKIFIHIQKLHPFLKDASSFDTTLEIPDRAVKKKLIQCILFFSNNKRQDIDVKLYEKGFPTEHFSMN